MRSKADISQLNLPHIHNPTGLQITQASSTRTPVQFSSCDVNEALFSCLKTKHNKSIHITRHHCADNALIDVL